MTNLPGLQKQLLQNLKTAIHEAGHAIGYFTVKCRFDYLVVYSESKQGVSGMTVMGVTNIPDLDKALELPKARLSRMIDRHIFIELAGYVAELIIINPSVSYVGSTKDIEGAVRLARFITDSDEDAMDYAVRHFGVVYKTLNTEENRAAIKEIAITLMGQVGKPLKYHEARKIFNSCLGK